MAQDGRTRGGTFHGEIKSCRESQGWTTACSSMPKRDGKDQGEDEMQNVRLRETLADMFELVPLLEHLGKVLVRVFVWLHHRAVQRAHQNTAPLY
ncbi:unnamed protein product [Ascophyllum nodosum]